MIASRRNYEKYISEIIKGMLLKNENKINIKLHIIDTKINVYILYKFKSLFYTLEEKNIRLSFDTDTRKWWCLIKIKDIKDDELLDKIAYVPDYSINYS